jgi:DNA-directed RNA polymerase specialized sigma subunit
MPTVKLTYDQALEARKLYRQRIPQREIAARLGVTRGNISEIVRGKTWGLSNISRGKAKGEDNHSKLSETDVLAVRLLYAHGFKPNYIAGKFGVSSAYIYRLHLPAGA